MCNEVVAEVRNISRSSHPSLWTYVAAGGVGVALPFVARLAGGVLADLPVLDWMCPTGGLECLVPLALSAVAVAIVSGWPLLLVVRVRSAWIVALLGGALSLGLCSLIVASGPDLLLPYLLCAACGVSYAAAAYVVAMVKSE